MSRQNIAVIGSGIAGLSAAWLLSRAHRVTVYESADRLGGHSNTVDVDLQGGSLPVDTGFIVFNEANYPNLTALFRHLGVTTESTEMSFALSLDGGGYEYSGSGFGGFFGQSRNMASPRHWQLLGDLRRFFATAERRVAGYPEDASLADFVAGERYSECFVSDHIVPMGAAIWSTPMDRMLDFPARSFVDFYANHGMLKFKGRPAWRTVRGGSRRYVNALADDAEFEVQLGNGAERVVRHPGYVHIEDSHGAIRPFDHVVVATHADHALRLLDSPTALEAEHLGAFGYQPNRAVLHRDTRWMPRRKRVWASWNYLKSGSGKDDLCVTYWMNRLQNLKTNTNLFVTLNPPAGIHPKAVEGEFDYEHPVFDRATKSAQETLWAIQGQKRTWFCGSYFGFGFHEDGIQSGLAVAEQLGGLRRPWRIANESGRIGPILPLIMDAAE